MKKLLILFLLVFPILIFAIINISASIIGWYIPLPVEKVEVSLDNVNWSENINLDIKELTTEQLIVDIYVRVLPANARNHEITTFSSDDTVAEVNESLIKKDGTGILKVNIYEYGYSEITIITIDGKYEAKIDVSVINPNDDPNLVKSIILEYKDKLHSNYQFGYLNDLVIDFKYFPKEANQTGIIDQLTLDFPGTVKEVVIIGNGLGYFHLEFGSENNFQTFSVKTSELREAKYSFNVSEGYNIKGHSFNEIKTIVRSGKHVFQLQELVLPEQLVIGNGTSYDGNNFKITHPKIISGVAVNVVDDNTSLNQVHIVGPLIDVNGQIIPSENVINLRMSGSINTTKQSITNSTIENGRYNLMLVGKSRYDGIDYLPTQFEVSNVSFVGALMSSVNIDNSQEGALMIQSTEVLVENLKFEWAGVGILMQNSQSSTGQKGYSVLHVLPSTNDDLVNSIDGSRNWRNLDEASGILQEQNVLGLLDELKTYENAIHKEGKYYYVSAVIMVRGGATNYSKVELDPKTYDDLLIEKRIPSTMEAMHPAVGGRYPFTVYLLNPKYYQGGISNETN